MHIQHSAFVQSCIHAVMKTHLCTFAAVCVHVHLAGEVAGQISFIQMFFSHHSLD